MRRFLVRTLALVIAAAFLILPGCKKKESEAELLEDQFPQASSAPAVKPAIEVVETGPAVQAAETLPEPDGIPDATEETPPPKLSYDTDFERYKNANDDVIGWLSVPNTRIEYPVVRGTDNEFYLHHTAEKKYSKSGSVFMDYRNAEPDAQRNLIIYGHNMRNGTMFHDLTSYKVKSFFNNAGEITLYLDGKKQVYDVYAAYIVTADIYFIKTKFASDEEFVSYMNELRAQSKFTPEKDIKLDGNSKILTLSTCTYEYDNSRYVVQAVQRS